LIISTIPTQKGKHWCASLPRRMVVFGYVDNQISSQIMLPRMVRMPIAKCHTVSACHERLIRFSI
jgi:hypothetical protein